MSSFPPKSPDRFAFTLRFPDLRLAVDLVRMATAAETINMALGPTALLLIREHNGVRCTAEIPIAWKSIAWSETPLLFSAKGALFDRLLRHDSTWETAEFSGDYPGAALDASNPERICRLRVQISETDIRWPLTFVQRLDAYTPASADAQITINSSVLSQAMNLISQVAAPDPLDRSHFGAASFGDGRAVVLGRAARIVYHQELSFEVFNVPIRQLRDLSNVLGRMGGQTKMIKQGAQITLSIESATCTFDTSRSAAFDPTEASVQLPLCQIETLTQTLSADLAKISSQSNAKDDFVAWRLNGESRIVQLNMQVPGGDAKVSFLLPETPEEKIPKLDLKFDRRVLATLTPLGRAQTTALSFYPTMILARQVHDETTVETFIQSLRQTN